MRAKPLKVCSRTNERRNLASSVRSAAALRGGGPRRRVPLDPLALLWWLGHVAGVIVWLGACLGSVGWCLIVVHFPGFHRWPRTRDEIVQGLLNEVAQPHPMPRVDFPLQRELTQRQELIREHVK